ncbi:WD repeat-containing protein 19 [Clydaea vesicula]|uniref:WD repeat-containing protein 19 n=1 Tax=Clydaea vesicula TaxID=447962 RepID=A0AAD5U7Q0_9FUNG|nr:WD repeat-containing protein 19 [Clydaea vesicula]
MTISDQALVDQKISSIVATSPDLIKRSVEIEPTIVGLGPTHFVIGLDNNAWFYSIRGPKKDKPLVKRQSAVSRLLPSTSDFNSLAFKKSFVANIVSISLNAQFSSVLLADGKLYLNSIEEQEQNTIEKSKQFQKVFPEKDILLKIKPGKDFKVTCVELTNEFLIYGTSNGLIHHYVLKEWVLVNEIKHKYGIRNLAVNEKGVKFTFIDDKNEAYLCNPASNTMLRIVGGLPNSSGMIWNKIINSPAQNQSHRNIFVSWNNNSINTFSYQPFTTRGAECVLLGATRLPHGMIPITAINGVLTCLTASGKLSLVPLISNEEIKESNRTGTMLYVPKLSSEVETKNEIEQGRILQLYYSLGQMKEIWNLIPIIKTTKPWLTLVEQALHVLDILTAKRIYRQILGNVGMVLTLEDLEWIDDRNLIAGHVSSILGNISLAQDFFLKSSNPIAILELRRDLMHWEQALNLAQTLAPQEVTIIAKEYAHQLEFDGIIFFSQLLSTFFKLAKYSEAFAMYEKALSTSSTHTGHEDQLIDHQIACSGGLTRMTCRMGDIARGMKMLNGCTDKQLLSECGSILESLKQYPESGSLFERAEKWERAAESYIKAKNWTKVGSLIPLINNSKIIVQYGKNREAEKLYQDAALAYEKGRDYFSLVRIYVDHLKNIDAAVAIVRKTQCRKSAKLVSKFFQSIKDYKSVIEFYVMAGIIDEAFEIATQNDVVEHFAEIIKDETSTEMLLNISNYFENKKQFFLAGKYLLQCGQYSKALHMLLQCPTENSAAIDLAIETVGLANNDGLTHELIDFLMGERDGVAKEAKYIFRLHMSLKQYKEAARTAIIIAREEQMLGNYRAAHDLLLDNYCQLRNMKAKVPSELAKMLMLLHSYILVKVLIRLDDHEKGAQMLIRVSNSISKFPSHIVPILTSTVIECQRAGLKRHALDFAAMLMRPEYRNKVDAKYKKKIEQIVRRPDKDQVVESENKSPCPFCNSNIPDSLLDCPECKNQLPYCIATGRHMLFDDWTQCPHCEFPALYSHLKVVVQKNQQCPMCSKSLKLEQLVFVKDPTEHLRGKKEEKDLEEKGLEETGGFVKNTGNLEVKVMKGISKQNDIGGNSGIQIAPAATANMNCATYINV